MFNPIVGMVLSRGGGLLSLYVLHLLGEKHRVEDFSMPFDMGFGDFICSVPAFGPAKTKSRTAETNLVREVLDGLEQMYEDLYGGE